MRLQWTAGFALGSILDALAPPPLRRDVSHHTMKPLLPPIASFSAGAVLGQIAHTFLFQIWAQFGPHPPNRGWYILWINAPSWVLAAFVGFFLGIFIKRRLMILVLLFGLPFAFAPAAIYWYLYSGTPTFRGVVGDAVAIPIIIGAALLIREPIRLASPQGGAKGRQPSRSEDNTTSPAAAPRRPP